MFQGTKVGTGKARRMAAGLLVGASMLTLTAIPAAAQSYGGDGKVSAAVDCSLATHKATMTVFGLNPLAYNKLYYYIRVLAKDRIAPVSAYKTIAEYQVGPVTTSRSNGGVTWNDPIWLVNTYFYGSANHRYDIRVQYWLAVPGGPWGTMGQFRVQDDLGEFTYLGQTTQSTITTNGVATSDCTL